MPKAFVGLAALATLVSSTATFAADLSASPPPPPVGWSSGLYAGAMVGGAFSSLTTHPSSGGTSAAGVSTGTLVGYVWRVNPWAFGVEGDISTNSVTQKFGGAGGLPPSAVASIYALHARARLGYDVGDFEPFIAGGLAYDDLNQNRQSPAEFDGASGVRPGWTIGAGVDARLQLPILGQSIVRAEYLYERLENGGFDLNGVNYRTGGGVQYVRVGLITYVGEHARPAVSSTVDWSGIYVGVIGGWENGSVSTSGSHFSANGGLVGVYTGHNWLYGNAVVGFDGSTTFASVRGSGPQPGAIATHYDDYFISDFRGKVGYAWGRWLPYVAAGLAFDQSAQSNPVTGDYRGAVASVSGTIGAGVDYMLTDHIALRTEYAYSHALGSTTTRLDSESCCSQTHDGNSLRMGVGYFFH